MADSFKNGYALLIGVNDSQVASLKLEAVGRDIDGLHRVLASSEHCGYLTDNIKAISGAEATRTNILAGLTWLKDKLRDDGSGNATVIIYYSGHGHRDPKGYFMLPYDVDDASLRATSIRADDFADGISALKPKRLLVLLDCCHAGGVGNLTKGVDPAGADAAPPLPIKSAPAPVELFMDDGEIAPDTATTSGGSKGLNSALGQNRGRTVISSSQGEELSYVLRNGKMSVFTYHLVQALLGHASATTLSNGETAVAVLDIAKYLDEHVPVTVMQEQGQQVSQRPSYKINEMSFPIALVRGGTGYAKGATPPDAVVVIEALKAGPSVVQQANNSVGVIQISGSGNTVNQTVHQTINVNLAPALAAMQQAASAGGRASPETRSTLVKALEDEFSLEEIRDLCFDMGLDPDNIPGNTKASKARELIMYCERRGTVRQLGEAIRRARPGLG